MQNCSINRTASFSIMAVAIFTLAACNDSPAAPANEPTDVSTTELGAVPQIGAAPIEAASLANNGSVDPAPSAAPAVVSPDTSSSDRAAIPSFADATEIAPMEDHSGHDMENMSGHAMPGMGGSLPVEENAYAKNARE